MSNPHDRLRRLEAAMPPPATDAPFDATTFSDDEIRTMEAVASRYPPDAFRRGGGLSALSDDDLDALAGIAERIKASRDDGEEATTATR